MSFYNHSVVYCDITDHFFVCFWGGVGGHLAAVSAVLSSPTNIRLTSYNMNLVLRWDPPEGAARVLVYTAEYG